MKLLLYADMYESYKQSSYWDLVEQPPQGTVLHIVRAEKSDRYVQEPGFICLSHPDCLPHCYTWDIHHG